VAREHPGLPFVLNLRLDVLGIIDPVEQMISDRRQPRRQPRARIFEVYGDAAMRFSWGTTGYLVVTVGGSIRASTRSRRISALRRVGLAMDSPIPIIEVRAEGYFAVTSSSIQFRRPLGSQDFSGHRSPWLPAGRCHRSSSGHFTSKRRWQPGSMFRRPASASRP
jgi:hypothetical protein